MKPSKRNILWLIPLAIIGLFFWFYGPQKDITDNETITYVKNYTLTNSVTIEKLLNTSCVNPYWKYFESQRGQTVVEFEGDCSVTKEEGKMNIQFLVDDKQTKVSVGAMLFNSAQLSDKEKNQFMDSLIAKK